MGRGVGSDLELAERRRAEHVDEHSAPRRWTDIVKPGSSVGPSQPRNGFEILVAEKAIEIDEQSESATFRFSIATWQWEGAWQRISPLSEQEVSEIAGELELTWPATTDINVFAAAWFDFTAAVERHNRVRWARQGGDLRRGSSQLSQQLRAADLLDGPTVIIGDLDTTSSADEGSVDFLAQPARGLDDLGRRKVIRRFGTELELRLRRLTEAWEIDATHTLKDTLDAMRARGLLEGGYSDPDFIYGWRVMNLVEHLPQGGYDSSYNLELVADWVLRQGGGVLESIDSLIADRLGHDQNSQKRRLWQRKRDPDKLRHKELLIDAIQKLPAAQGGRAGYPPYRGDEAKAQRELWQAAI